MAETLISPGVLARENDQSQITSQPIQAGAAIVGPTVKGQVNIPKLITTYSEYQANFGTTFESGSVNQLDEYTFFTSISAYNYFQNGGTSLIVTRVASGTFSSATSSTIFNEVESGNIPISTNLFGSYTSGGSGGTAGIFSPVTPTVAPAGGSGLTLSVTTNTDNGKLDAIDVDSDVNPTNCGTGPFAGVAITSTLTGVNALGTVTIDSSDPTAPDILSIAITTAGTGYASGETVSIAAGELGTGQLITADSLPITANAGMGSVTGPFVASDSTVDPTNGFVVAGGASQDGLGATISILGDGAGNLTSVTVSSIGTNYVVDNTLTIAASKLVNLGFTGATVDVVVTLGSSNLQNSSAASFILTATDLLTEVAAITTVAEGTGYAVGDVLTVAAADIGTPTADLVVTLVDADITDENAFTLETIGEGVIMNSAGAENAQGALTNGTSDNLRWEVVSPNTTTGTFSVIIRQGNDNTRSKSVIENFNNVSLDPKSSNYISRIIGDQKQVVRGSGTDVYLQTTGSFANASRYVRVKSVNFKTPDYLDNSGQPKAAFIPSIPVAGSGSFGDAQGSILTGTGKYYDKITADDTQGLVGTDYTTAINLLANKDDYKYNLISTPGLYQSDYSSTLNTLVANTENRGDNIVVLDLEAYASSLTATTTTAASKDTSYAASYWPWVYGN